VNCLANALHSLEDKVDEQNERFQSILSELVRENNLLSFPWPSVLLFTANVLAVISIVKCLCGKRKNREDQDEQEEESTETPSPNKQVVVDYFPSGHASSLGVYHMSPEIPVVILPQQQTKPSTLNSGLFYPGNQP